MIKDAENTKFPIYRKYKNGHKIFKIHSFSEFEEILTFGSKYAYSKVTASQYPEMVFIQDLIFQFQEYAEKSTESEFEEFRLKLTAQG